MELNTFINDFGLMAEAPNGVQKLREMVFQLAFQGKLVPQNSKSEPASVLLKKIMADMELIIKKRKVKKGKTLQPITENEKPYKLPNSWEWVRLGNIIKVKSGDGLTKQKMEKGIIPVYGGNGVTGYHNDFNVKKKTVVIGRVGFYCGSVHLTPEKAWITDNAFETIYSENNIYQEFLIWLLKATELNRNDHATAQPVISGAKIYPLLVQLPPFEEQKRIVEKVYQLMKLCDELEERNQKVNKSRIQLNDSAIDKLLTASAPNEFNTHWNRITNNFELLYNNPENVKKLRQAILQLAVQGKLVPQNPRNEPASVLLDEIKFEKDRLIREKKLKKTKSLPPIDFEAMPFKLPVGWQWTYLGECLLKITDGTHHSPINTPKGKYKYITAKNIKNDGLDLSNVTYVTQEVHDEIFARCDPELGDILYIKDGATTGITTINSLSEQFSMLSSVALLKLPKQIFNEYLLYLLRSPYYYDLMRAGMTGVAITRVTLKKLNCSIVPIPPLEEQNQIVKKLDRLMSLGNILESKLAVSERGCDQLLEASINEFTTTKSK
jgi:type I restriction enzyme S subunit